MKVLVTGSSGMLGQDLCQELVDEYEVVGLDVRDVQVPDLKARMSDFLKSDITDPHRTTEIITKINPDIVIHAAAYTDVDGCELSPDKAEEVNAIGTQNVALACQKCAAPIFYLSTDFIFDGNKKTPYTESDPPNPLNIYGKSKLAGEGYLRSLVDNFFIVRTSRLFGRAGKNFVDAILDKAKKVKVLKVVNDQFGSPTYTRDLAKAIGKLISLLATRYSLLQYGIYHITNSGSCSWYEFALKILELANMKGATVTPITSGELNRPAKRPKMSILDNSRYTEITRHSLRHWSEALGEYLNEE